MTTSVAAPVIVVIPAAATAEPERTSSAFKLAAVVTPAKVYVPVSVKFETSVVLVMPVIERLPVPAIFSAVTTDAAAVIVFVAATVVVAVPKLPVKVPDSLKVAVTVVDVIVLKSASRSVSRSVMATVPAPLIISP